MQVLGYVRVSTDEQARNGAGLEAQRQAIVSECQRQSWKLVEVIEDQGYSGKSLKRPGIRSALARLKAGKVDGLVVAKLDRLSRDVSDFAEILKQAGKQGWSLVLLDVGVDTSTPAGEVAANLLVAIAQFERKRNGERTREGMAAKKAQGVVFGRRRELPKRVANRIARERAKGMSLAAIAEGLNRDSVPCAHGGQKWWPETVRGVLRYAKG